MSQTDASGKTFSESWHKVAKVRACLRPSVRAWRQDFRDVQWYVLQDSLSNHFFRVTAEAYAFLGRLSPDRQISDVWQESIESDPEAMLSQEEVVQLLGQLYLNNLLYFDRPTATASLFERYSKRRQREVKAKLMGFLSIKIPLIDPNRLLNRGLPFIHFLYSPLGFLLYGTLLVLGLKVLIENNDRLFGQGVGLLSADNLPLLYVGFIISKVVHEFSHAIACKRFGGEVHVMGVMLLIGAPMPYVDASASWGFRQGWKRLVVAAAGMIGEFALAAIAVMIWANTAPGPLNSVAYNVIFVASVSTLLFNINPLLRFDGYYMFIDLFGIPNLFQRSRDQLKYISERYLFGSRGAKPIARTPTESILLPLYGIASLLYWVVLISTIVFFIATEYLDLGVLVAFLLCVMFVVVPLFKLFNYLFFSPRLMQQRGRALMVSFGLVLLTIFSLGVIEVPDRLRASGVVEAVHIRHINSEEGGFLVEILVTSGTQVIKGQPLARLHNDSIGLEINLAQLQRKQLMVQELRAESIALADLNALRRQLVAVESSLSDLKRRQIALVVTAPISGIWVAPEFDQGIGRWIDKGTSLGQVIDQSEFRFVAVLPQISSHLFDGKIQQIDVRLNGQEDINMRAISAEVIPFEHGQLPSFALGMPGGGEIAVSSADESGLTATEPFFLIHVYLDQHKQQQPTLIHGRLGILRLTLPDKPLLWQWERGLRQFFQRRFQV